MSVEDLKKALEQKSKTIEDIVPIPTGLFDNKKWISLEDALDLFSVFQKDNIVVSRKQLSELIKQCPLVPTLYNMTLYNMTVLERSRLLAEHSVALDEWYHNLKKELLEAQK